MPIFKNRDLSFIIYKSPLKIGFKGLLYLRRIILLLKNIAAAANRAGSTSPCYQGRIKTSS